jgi:hypothetical protein
MKRLLGPLALLGLALALMIYAWQNPRTFEIALRQPFQSLWSSQQTLNAKLIDISDLHEPIEAAGRRLFRPFSHIRRVRQVPGTKES